MKIIKIITAMIIIVPTMMIKIIIDVDSTEQRNSENKPNLNSDNNNNDDANNNYNNKTFVFILGDIIVKNLYGIFITKVINHEYIVKISMYDNVNSTIRDISENIILHVGINDFDETIRETLNKIARPVTDLTFLLNTITNIIHSSYRETTILTIK